MIDIVDETLALWRRSVFEYGQTDCLLSIGDYIARCGGIDIASRFRGTYSTQAAALALMGAYGGPQGLIDLTGLLRCAEPVRGDVVVLDTGDDRIGAICTGAGIAARMQRRVMEVDRRLVRIPFSWSVNLCRR